MKCSDAARSTEQGKSHYRRMAISSENGGAKSNGRAYHAAQSTVLVTPPPEARLSWKRRGGRQILWFGYAPICTYFPDSCRIVGCCSGWRGGLLTGNQRRGAALSDGCGVISKVFSAPGTCGKRPIIGPAWYAFRVPKCVCREACPEPRRACNASLFYHGKVGHGELLWRIDCGSGLMEQTLDRPYPHLCKTRCKSSNLGRMRRLADALG